MQLDIGPGTASPTSSLTMWPSGKASYTTGHCYCPDLQAVASAAARFTCPGAHTPPCRMLTSVSEPADPRDLVRAGSEAKTREPSLQHVNQSWRCKKRGSNTPSPVSPENISEKDS